MYRCKEDFSLHRSRGSWAFNVENLVIRALRLKHKILCASQDVESALKYDPVLVQSMFLHTVLTGLQNDSIRSDLQPHLQPLLEKHRRCKGKRGTE